MLGWPSKDPDDYGSDQARPATDVIPAPPYLVGLSLSLVGAGVIVATAVAVGGLTSMQLFWVFLGGSWVSRSHVTRWWQCKHGFRTASWRPASAFAAVSIVTGLAVAAALTTSHSRGLAIYIGVLVAWWAGDTLDWLWRRHDSRAAVLS